MGYRVIVRAPFIVCALTLGSIGACASSTAPHPADPPDAASPSNLDCEVAIVGGGAGGLHTAFRLAPMLGAKICLFEKDKELGGRILDVSVDDRPESPKIGLGARRVGPGMVAHHLARELGIDLERPPIYQELINARGIFSFDSDELAKRAYPGILSPPMPETHKEAFLYERLLGSTERAQIGTYPDFATYAKKVIGEESFAFLRDVSRLRDAFVLPIDARSYVDMLESDKIPGARFYAKGGMSAIIRGMERRTKEKGVRIFKEEPVNTIHKRDDGYELVTTKHSVHASKVVIALPPVGLDKISGDVAERIKAAHPYNQIFGVRAVVITQFWPEAWWKDIKNPSARKNANTWRAWTTAHCLGSMEIPMELDAESMKVTRSVYVDDPKCVSYWEDLAKESMGKVEEEISNGLTALFNNGGVSVPVPVTIPKPLKTVFKVWPAGWHYLKAGAGATLSNVQLADWAIEPLPGDPVSLVGEAYFVNRSAWTDGAYLSSIKLLNAKFGMNLPGGE